MKALVIIAIFYLGIFTTAQAQTTAKDSIAQIEQERMELDRMQDRLRAKQDSLVRERQKIEQEQKKAEAARQSSTRTSVTPQPAVPMVYSVHESEHKNVVGLAPLHLFITGIDVFYERALGKKTSIVFSGGYHGMENFPRVNSNGSTNNSNIVVGGVFLNDTRVANYGMRAQVQLRAYLFEEAGVLEKLYIAPTFLYKHDEMVYIRNRSSYLNGSSPAIYDHYFAEAVVPGVDVGYQIKVLRYFTLTPSVGFMYTLPLSSKENVDEVNLDFINPYRQNLMIRTGLTVGFTF